MKFRIKYRYENRGDLDYSGRCPECRAIYTRRHADDCSFTGKVGELKKVVAR